MANSADNNSIVFEIEKQIKLIKNKFKILTVDNNEMKEKPHNSTHVKAYIGKDAK